jgi:tRNA pseudouridine55 synthase
MDSVIKSGFLLINKPVGMSSYGCIGRIKRVAQQKIRIGHAGTLDPFASGLLIVAIGREATRLLSQCMALPKIYVATGKCGELTDTLDCTGTVVATTNVILSEQALHDSLESFGTSYEQTPPAYSALKYQGMPLYALARKKIVDEQELQRIADAKKRTVQLYDKQFLSYEAPFFTIQVTVSQGTYIRTLINDIAMRADSYATTYQLVRTAIGPFILDKAIDISLLTHDNLNEYIIEKDVFFH